MIRKVSDIMLKNFIEVSSLDGIRHIQEIAVEKRIECFPVMEENQVVGILTSRDLMSTHPNRIAADAMRENYEFISYCTPIWEAKELFDQKDLDVLFVEQDKKIVGIVTRTLLYTEFGKHIDLLTGLYKSDYIYYHAAELIKSGSEISIIFLDVDNFGQINKEFGHIIGDEILKEIAFLLNNNILTGVRPCRFGGDEFILLTPYYINDCKALAEKMLKIVETHDFPHGITVTVSIGISGGRRYNKRVTDVFSTVSNLINIASLASTKAKQEKTYLAVAVVDNVGGIAI
jgi:diguanylate cyclase (GGDEF)-like protein